MGISYTLGVCYFEAFYSFCSSLSFNLLTIWQSDRCSGHGLWNGWRRSRKQKCPWKSNTGINLILSILWLLSLELFPPFYYIDGGFISQKALYYFKVSKLIFMDYNIYINYMFFLLLHVILFFSYVVNGYNMTW